jgi:hypothetical protein
VLCYTMSSLFCVLDLDPSITPPEPSIQQVSNALGAVYYVAKTSDV